MGKGNLNNKVVSLNEIRFNKEVKEQLNLYVVNLPSKIWYEMLEELETELNDHIWQYIYDNEEAFKSER